MVEKRMPCAHWRKGDICALFSEPGITDYCVLGPCSYETPSHGDRIRAMSDEELAKWIVNYMDCAECENMNGYKPCHNGECCPDHWLDWLKSPAAET